MYISVHFYKNIIMYICIYLFIQLFHLLYYLAPLFQVVWITLIVCWLFVFVLSFVHFLIHSPKSGLDLLQNSQLRWGCDNYSSVTERILRQKCALFELILIFDFFNELGYCLFVV